MPAPKVRTNTKKYAVAVEAQEEADRQHLLEIYAPPMSVCAGGRLVHSDFVCAHCGSDNSPSECLESMEQLMQKRADWEVDRKKIIL